jgi:outer membrane protein OmpA-like peptidoglycan-associated protein
LVGELNYNFKLSQDIADEVADLLRGYLPAYRYDEVKGIGPTDIKYDNSIPEGRFYCRTVLIEVKTPIKVE